MVGAFLIISILLLDNIKNRLMLLCFVLPLLLIVTYNFDYLHDYFILQRYSQLQDKYTGDLTLYGIAYLIGRQGIFDNFYEVISSGRFLGVGPLTVWKIAGSDIPFHNLFYSIYLSFGLIGFSIFFSFYGRYIHLLWKIYRKNSGLFKNTALSLLLLLIILLIEQLKVSTFRISYGIFQYWTLIALIAALPSVIQNSTIKCDTKLDNKDV